MIIKADANESDKTATFVVPVFSKCPLSNIDIDKLNEMEENEWVLFDPTGMAREGVDTFYCLSQYGAGSRRCCKFFLNVDMDKIECMFK